MKKKSRLLGYIPRSDSKDLADMSRVNDVLNSFLKNKSIISFERYAGQDKNALEYRVYHYKDRSFILKLYFASIFHPRNGAEIAENKGWQLTIAIDRAGEPAHVKKLVYSFVENYIASLIKGIEAEILCLKNILNLIETDREVSRIIRDARLAYTFYEDAIEKIDLFLILVCGIDVKIQIKTSLFGKRMHIRSGSEVDTLWFTPELLEKSGLKNSILKICKFHTEKHNQMA